MARAPRTTNDRPTNTGWRLQDAKARFSELVRRAQAEGPQRVTVRGQDAVVVISVTDMDRLAPPSIAAVPFVTFMESLDVDGIDLARDRDTGRGVAF